MPLESSLGEEARYVSVSRGGGPGEWGKDVVPKGIIFCCLRLSAGQRKCIWLDRAELLGLDNLKGPLQL